MGSGKQEKKRSKSAPKFPKSGKHKKLPLGPNRPKTKKPKNINIIESKTKNKNIEINNNNSAEPATPSQLLSFFLNQYQSSNGIQLSSLELESIKGALFLNLYLCMYVAQFMNFLVCFWKGYVENLKLISTCSLISIGYLLYFVLMIKRW